MFFYYETKENSSTCSNNVRHLFSQYILCLNKKNIHQRIYHNLNVCVHVRLWRNSLSYNHIFFYRFISFTLISKTSSNISHTFPSIALHNHHPRWRQLYRRRNEKSTRATMEDEIKCKLSIQSQLLVKIMRISKLHKKSQTYHAICSIFFLAKMWSYSRWLLRRLDEM